MSDTQYAVNGEVHDSPPYPYEDIKGKLVEVTTELLTELGHDVQVVKRRYKCRKCGKLFTHQPDRPCWETDTIFRHELAIHEIEESGCFVRVYHKPMDSLGPKAVLGERCGVDNTPGKG